MTPEQANRIERAVKKLCEAVGAALPANAQVLLVHVQNHRETVRNLDGTRSPVRAHALTVNVEWREGGS